MAIYHLTAKIVSRARGQSAVASAAYRAGSKLRDYSTGELWDYSKKLGVEHAEILAPEGAPAWVFDRQTLWNTVESVERRKDSQLAREVEVGLPVELSTSEQLALLKDFVQREFVARGMVADIGVHLDNPANPHAHILLTMRDLGPEGFGLKNTAWNQTAALLGWRRGWAEVTNQHLAEAGLGIRIDHRSYREQGLRLVPGRKIGVGLSRQHDERLPGFLADRVAEQRAIMAANGLQILAEPGIALKALTQQSATFTHHDVARFLNTRTADAEQFQAAYLKVTTAPELVGLGVDEQGRQRFTTREMFDLERSLLKNAERLARTAGHGVGASRRAAVVLRHALSEEQAAAFEHVTGAGDLKSLVGVAGSGKSTTLAAMREAWAGAGYAVKGAALSGIAAENLEVAAGIGSRTVASYELAWVKGHDPLTARDVLVIDEAGMLGTRQLARVLEVAKEAGAKVVLVGDPEQLQAIEAGAPFRGIAAQHGVAELTQVRRQREGWQREATKQLASEQTSEALDAYAEHGAIVAVGERSAARAALLARWAKDGQESPEGSQLVLAYTREDVKTLNSMLRTLRQQTGQLGESREMTTGQGVKEFSVNDRVRFLRNDRSLGVKNGTLGTIEGFDGKVLTIRLDGEAGKRLTVDPKFYAHLDHGYAATVHKAQGTTVDRAYVLATPYFDRHTAYVALSRHREAATVFYAKDDFGGRGGSLSDEAVHARMTATLSRARPKELAHDYLETVPVGVTAEGVSTPPAAAKPTLEEIRREARERWRAERERTRDRGPAQSLEEMRRQGREDWLKLRAEREGGAVPPPELERGAQSSQALELERSTAAEVKPAKDPSPDLTLEQIKAQGRQGLEELRRALEAERQRNQEREAALEQERELKRSRGRGRGLGDDEGPHRGR